MNLLAFDTGTDTLSIALAFEEAGAPRLLAHTADGGARASAALIPVILALLARADLRLADLDAIVFGRGPGSFTGLRTACAVAQGLAFGAGVPVLAVDTLLAVAEEARQQHGVTRVVTLLDARMDEVYSAAYVYGDPDGDGGWQRQGEFSLGRPEALAWPHGDDSDGWVLAGNAFTAHADRLPAAARRIEALPTAAALLRLAPALLAAGQAGTAAGALPLYIRDKVAQTTEERAALRAAMKVS